MKYLKIIIAAVNSAVVLIKTIKGMKAIKKIKENAVTSPKTSKKGVMYSLGIAVIGLAANMIASKSPALAEVLNENQEAFYIVLSSICSLVLAKFLGKRDK